MKLRVLRLIEYTYDSVERMESDMARWQHGTHTYGTSHPVVVKSVHLPLEVLESDTEVALPVTIGQRLIERTEEDWFAAESEPTKSRDYLHGLAEVHDAMRTSVTASVKQPDDLAGIAHDLTFKGESFIEVRTACDVCTVANLADEGKVNTSVSAETLHSRCRQDGCTCGCDYAQGARCGICGAARPWLALDETASGFECIDRDYCLRTLQAQRAASITSGSRPCGCGCGGSTKGGSYLVGHSTKHLAALVAAVQARGMTLEHALEQLPTESLRERLRKQLGGTT